MYEVSPYGTYAIWPLHHDDLEKGKATRLTKESEYTIHILMTKIQLYVDCKTTLHTTSAKLLSKHSLQVRILWPWLILWHHRGKFYSTCGMKITVLISSLIGPEQHTWKLLARLPWNLLKILTAEGKPLLVSKIHILSHSKQVIICSHLKSDKINYT